MVSFSGAMRGLGEGLKQLGEHRLQEESREAADRRLMDRSTALARLNQTIDLENDATKRERDISTNTTRDKQLIRREEAELSVREPFRVREEQRTERREERRDDRAARRQAEEGSREPIDEYTADDGRRVYVFRNPDGSLRESYSSTRARDSDSPAGRLVKNAETGTYWRYMPDGSTTDTGIRYPEGGGDDDDDDWLTGGSGGSTPARGATSNQPRRIRYDANGRRISGD